MERRKAGRAERTPLRQVMGRAARTAACEEKNANMDVCVFSTFRPPAADGGCPSPFEPWKDGFVTGTERSGAEGTNPSYLAFERGKPGGEGEEQYMTAHNLPPEYAGLMGCAAPGWA
jgi:hypothetical protein